MTLKDKRRQTEILLLYYKDCFKNCFKKNKLLVYLLTISLTLCRSIGLPNHLNMSQSSTNKTIFTKDEKKRQKMTKVSIKCRGICNGGLKKKIKGKEGLLTLNLKLLTFSFSTLMLGVTKGTSNTLGNEPTDQ